VAGDHEASLVDQDRNQKSECRDAVSDLADLLLRMCPCVTRVRLERVVSRDNLDENGGGNQGLKRRPVARS
jgi:hypothetical protein